MSVRVFAALAVPVFFAGCAAFAPQPEDVPPGPPFDLSGRVVVSADGRAFSSGMRWQHAGDEDELWLMSPLGQALAHIRARPGNATLTTTDRQAYHAASVEGLTRRALGWALPLPQLQYWVQGMLVPAAPAQGATRDMRGRLIRIDQSGWRVQMEYSPSAEQNAQPRRLELTRGDQKIRLVIDDWRREGVPP